MLQSGELAADSPAQKAGEDQKIIEGEQGHIEAVRYSQDPSAYEMGGELDEKQDRQDCADLQP